MKVTIKGSLVPLELYCLDLDFKRLQARLSKRIVRAAESSTANRYACMCIHRRLLVSSHDV